MWRMFASVVSVFGARARGGREWKKKLSDGVTRARARCRSMLHGALVVVPNVLGWIGVLSVLSCVLSRRRPRGIRSRLLQIWLNTHTHTNPTPALSHTHTYARGGARKRGYISLFDTVCLLCPLPFNCVEVGGSVRLVRRLYRGLIFLGGLGWFI